MKNNQKIPAKMAKKTTCMKCGKRPATINYLCLICDTKWDDRKAEIAQKKDRKWKLKDFYKWIMKKP
jgi:hypothetical protein